MSAQVDIDEVSALRIALLEWQSRAYARMLTGYAAEERISLQGAVGRDVDLPVIDQATYFNSVISRRYRLLTTYLEERLHIIRCYVALVAATWLESPIAPEGRVYPPFAPSSETHSKWMNDVDDKASEVKEANKLVAQTITTMQARLAQIVDACGWTVGDAYKDTQIDHQFRLNQLQELHSLLHLTIVAISSISEPLGPGPVQAWFTWMNEVQFLVNFDTQMPGAGPIISSIRALISIVSMLMVRLPFALEKLDVTKESTPTQFYFQSGQCLSIILDALQNVIVNRSAPIIAPTLWSFLIILSEMRSQIEGLRGEAIEDGELSPVQTRMPDATVAAQRDLEQVMSDIYLEEGTDEDPIMYLAGKAVELCNLYQVLKTLAVSCSEELAQTTNIMPVLHVRIAILELMRQCANVLQYDEDMIQTTVEILGDAPNVSARGISQDILVKAFLVDVFLGDDAIFTPKLLQEAVRRFPYEHGPYLVLLDCLNQVRPLYNGQSLSDWFHYAQHFTQQLPDAFRAYQNWREDEITNHIILTEDLLLYGNRKLGNIRGARLIGNGSSTSDDDFRLIPAGTVGIMLSQNRPFVVSWKFEYSMWTYLGAALSSLPLSENKIDLFTPPPGLRRYAPEIISLFVTQLSNPGDLQDPTEHRDICIAALGEASNPLSNDQDILSVISDIFEEELGSFAGQRVDADTDLLVSCVRFFTTALPFLPSRIWPILGRSQLMDVDGHGGKLMSVASNLEVATGRYDFLLASADLFCALINDTLAHCVEASSESTAVSRFQESTAPQDVGSRPPVKYTSKLLLAFTRTYHDVLLSCNEWTFDDPTQKLDLTSKIASALNDIVRSVYAYDDTESPLKKATKALAPSAVFLTEAFLSKTASHLAINALLDCCHIGLTSMPISDPNSKISKMLLNTLSLVDTLLEVSIIESLPGDFLQTQFFRALPILVRLYGSCRPLRASILKTLVDLLRKAGLSEKEPPSLYGHLGGDVSKAFLTMLGLQQQALDAPDQSIETWTFLTTVIGSRQQWFATYILTGRDPREQAKKHSSNPEPHTPSLLDQALEQLSAMELEKSLEPLPILRFVRLSQNLWPWVTSTIKRQSTFLNKITDHLEVLGRDATSRNVEVELQLACKHASVAVVSEILAMYVHNARQLGDLSIVQRLAPKLNFFEKQGVLQPSYKEQLHRRLKEHFQQLLPGCRLDSFKRRFGQREIDANYYYDTEFATRLLGSRRSWKSGDKGLINDVGYVNSNLSLVEAQIQAIKGWRALAVELSRSVEAEKSIAEPLVFLVKECLSLCNSADLSHNIFESLVATTADLALTILQRLVAVTHNSETMRTVLLEAWGLVQRISSSTDFAGDGERLHRASLRTLFLAIQPWTWEQPGESNADTALGFSKGKITTLSTSYLTIVSDVVCAGFVDLSTQLHRTPQLVLPSDFSILTAILQSILMVLGIEPLHSLISLRIQDSGVARYATALFSWANRLPGPLADPSDHVAVQDPIYAELAMQFILECSNLQPTAEFLATDMVLAQLANAPLMAYYRRRGGVGQFDEPSRMFSVWARGVLPLCLNLLLTVGEAYALEVVNFLNGFPEQLARASECLDEKIKPSNGNTTAGCISLNMASEAQSLSLISIVLDKMRESPSAQVIGDIPELTWQRSTVKEDLDAWVTSSGEVLAQRVVPTNEKELAWARKKGASEGSSVLVDKVVGELSAALAALNRD